MMQPTTFSKLFSRLQQIDGKALALRRAAEHLEREAVAGDLGPAVRPLRSEALFDTLVPECHVRDMIDELNKQAKVLERERDRLMKTRFKLPTDAAGASGEDDDEPHMTGSSMKFQVVSNQ